MTRKTISPFFRFTDAEGKPLTTTEQISLHRATISGRRYWMNSEDSYFWVTDTGQVAWLEMDYWELIIRIELGVSRNLEVKYTEKPHTLSVLKHTIRINQEWSSR